jgi:hypothetical protein
MPKDEVLAALNHPDNHAIDATIGAVLKPRLDQAGWEDIILLQHLDQASPRLQAWNDLFGRARAALVETQALVAKASQSLQGVTNTRFNDALDDLVAEMLAVIYLAESGHTDITFVPDGNAITVDIQSQCEGAACFTEVKNLRDPRSLSVVAFKRWHRNLATEPLRFTFQVDLVDLDDTLSDLTSEQEASLNNLVDDLPNKAVPSEFVHTLPGARKVRVQLTPGAPVMLRHGGGPFLVGAVVERAKRSLLLKLMEPARKALTQLYRPEVPEDSKHLLFVRWKVPEDIAAIGEIDSVRVPVHERAKELFQTFFPDFSLVIAHTHQDPKDAPKAEWN